MYFEFSRRSRSSSQPTFFDSNSNDRKNSNPEKIKVPNTPTQSNSKENTLSPYSCFRSYSSRLFKYMNSSDSLLTSPNTLQIPDDSIRVVKESSSAIDKSISYIFEIKNPNESPSAGSKITVLNANDSFRIPRLER